MNDGADDRTIPFVVWQAAHEGLIDLELVDRQILEVSQARISGAKIVNRQPDAQVRKRLQSLRGLLGVLQQHGFRQLQFEQPGRQLGLMEHTGNPFDKIGLAQFKRRDIH